MSVRADLARDRRRGNSTRSRKRARQSALLLPERLEVRRLPRGLNVPRVAAVDPSSAISPSSRRSMPRQRRSSSERASHRTRDERPWIQLQSSQDLAAVGARAPANRSRSERAAAPRAPVPRGRRVRVARAHDSDVGARGHRRVRGSGSGSGFVLGSRGSFPERPEAYPTSTDIRSPSRVLRGDGRGREFAAVALNERDDLQMIAASRQLGECSLRRRCAGLP
jgi:hypothetical protein